MAADTQRARMRELLEQFHTGMLVTRTEEGTVRARPMSVAQLDAQGDLFFATSLESGKLHEIQYHHQVAVTFQSAKAYLSVSGPVRVLTDRARIEALWSEPMRVWFPEGKDDPSLCLLQLRPVQAEFWNLEGTKGLRYIVEAAKAYVTGTTPSPGSPEEHGVVEG